MMIIPMITLKPSGLSKSNPMKQPLKVCARDLSKPWDHILRIWLLYRISLAMGLSRTWRALGAKRKNIIIAHSTTTIISGYYKVN